MLRILNDFFLPLKKKSFGCFVRMFCSMKGGGFIKVVEFVRIFCGFVFIAAFLFIVLPAAFFCF